MTDGRPCGLKDGHKSQHRSVAGIEAQREVKRRYDQSDKGRARYRRGSAKYAMTHPLKIYERNERKRTAARQARYEAITNGE